MPTCDLDQLIDEVQAFHGQPIFVGLEVGIAKKRLLYRVIFSIVRFGSRFLICNLVAVVGLIFFYPHFRYPERGKSVFQYGPSRNNIAAFQRLNACLPNQLANQVNLNGRRITLGSRICAAVPILRLWAASRALQRKHTRSALPHLQSCIAIAAFLLHTRRPLPAEVRLVCVASDHSPVVMAILFLARRAGVKTCYIQHAPVTEYFPPLAFDLSLLYDRSSVRAYALSAAKNNVTVDQTVEIFPPFFEEFEQPHLGLAPYKIGICLSSIPQNDRVMALVDELCDHSAVSGVLLRCHPRFRIELASSNPDAAIKVQQEGQSLALFLEEVDIVLVPNSGVAVEALHRGRPTFYTDGMDQLPSDYYGFVGEGVLPEFRMQYLDDPNAILAHFDEIWQHRFAKYDATVESSITSTHKRVCEAVIGLLEEVDS